MKYSITKNGVPLDKSLYTIDEKTKTFSTLENGLVLDFSDENYCTFKTSYGCTFNTGFGCTFNTGFGCTFNTGFGCTFKTSSDCTFKTGPSCTFDTSFGCTFNTGSDCTFKTSFSCTFNTGFDCVLVRRDIYEVLELKERVKIKLNGCGVKGFTLIDTPKETIKIGENTYLKEEVENALKNIKSV